MSIVKMKKAAVIGLDTEKESLIADLMDLGVMQITQREVMDETLEDYSSKRKYSGCAGAENQ